METDRQYPAKKIPSTKKSEVVRPTANFPTVDLYNYDITEKTIDYIQVRHITEKP